MTQKITPTETVPFDAARLLDRPEDVAFFVADAMETGDAAYIQHALGVAARALGMAEVAEKAGLGRESLYKALKEDANPRFETVLKVMQALGLQLTVRMGEPAEAA
ncbi:putative addiction module antidote protein [Caulobacter sp. D4A]|uniref:addiction module antidote protein n=1 Tax=unclassified Caulobacter TaxID=2648921 RepID=UPI000D735AD3|nr:MULTISPECIES: addiction module antidote protein [unclassified Caulobacter]PXA89051.1 putative addiction module antidote protein [Caulobacter sp. D4A]PXA89356.1 putative addiction module antidote protein [Caulobacter sp. D5]